MRYIIEFTLPARYSHRFKISTTRWHTVEAKDEKEAIAGVRREFPKARIVKVEPETEGVTWAT